MAANTVDPKNETTEWQGPVSSYEVVEAKPLASDDRFVAAELSPALEESTGAVAHKAAERASAIKQSASQPAKRDTDKPARNSTKLFAALGAGLGIMAALAVVAFVLLPGKSDGAYDMGSMTSATNGLKGHLTTTWGNQLDYKLTIEPSDPALIAAFANAVNNPPRPLSVDVKMKDATGTVLCDNTILLKFDPLKNVPNATPNERSPKNKKIDEVNASREQVAQALNNARLVGQELSREHGKDIFQTVAGPDGQIASLSAQGTLPCAKKQYQSTASWAFTSNFPSILPPVGTHAPSPAQNYNSSASAADPDKAAESANSTVSNRMKRKVALPDSHFSIETDDALVGFQLATGILETRAGKSFLVEKRDMVASTLKGVELPIPIHYRCDQLGACALAGLGSGIQRAWMER